MERENQSPCHIPLKSKCRGTSPGRSSNVAQRLGRQAVTALGHSPACLAWPLPTPSGPGLWESGSRPPVDRPEPCTTYRVPSQSLCWVRNSGNIHQRERGPAELKGGVVGVSSATSQLFLHPGVWKVAQQSLLLMITPTSPPGHSAFRACAGPHIPMATVAGPSTQCEWATSQVLPNWDEGETFWENAQS